MNPIDGIVLSKENHIIELYGLLNHVTCIRISLDMNNIFFMNQAMRILVINKHFPMMQ